MSDRINALATLLSTAEYDDVGSDVWYGVVSDKRKLFESEFRKKDDDCIDSGIHTTTTTSSPLIKQSPPHGKEKQLPIQQQQYQLRKYQRPISLHQLPLEQQVQVGPYSNKLTSLSTTMKYKTGTSNSTTKEAITTARNNTAATLICLVSLGCHDRIQSSNQNRSLSWLTTKGVPFVIVDGNDVTSRDIRDELFELSGIRGNYPQFFIERHNGQIEYFGNFDRLETLNETSSLPPEVLAMHPELETWADITFENTNIDDYEVTETNNLYDKYLSATDACDNTDGDSAGIQSTDTQSLTVNDSTAAAISMLDSNIVNTNSGEESSLRLYLQPNFLDQFAKSLSEDEEQIIEEIHTDEEFDKANGGTAEKVKHDIKTATNRDNIKTLQNKIMLTIQTEIRPSLNVQVDNLENMANGVFSPRTPRGILSHKEQSICASAASHSSYDSRSSHGLKSSQAVAIMPPQSPSSRMRLALSPRSNEGGKAATITSAQLVYNNKVVKGQKCNIPKSPRSKPPQSPRIVGTKTSYINTPPVAESPRTLLQEGIASFDTADFCHDFDEDDTDNEEKDISTSVERSIHTLENRQSGSDEDKMQGQDMNINISECDDHVDEKMLSSKSNPREHINEVTMIEMDEEDLKNNNLSSSMHQMWLKQMQLTASIIERFQNDVGSFKTMVNQDGGNDNEGEDLLVAAARLAKSLDRFLIVERQGCSNTNSTVMTKVMSQGKQDEAHHDADLASSSSSCNEQGEYTSTGIEKQYPTSPKPEASVCVIVKDPPASDDHSSLNSSLRRASPKLKEKSKLEISIDGFQELYPSEKKQEDIFFMAAEPSPCHGDDTSLFNGSATKRTRNSRTLMWNSPAKNILRLFGIIATKNNEDDTTSFHSLSSK
jgi:hypothetical protein